MEALMRAYKFLAPGAVGPFSGFAWPTGTPGPWVEAVPHTCATGVHACAVEDLPHWIHQELWEVELEGAERAGRKLVAPRGRLLRRIEAWNAGSADEFSASCASAATAMVGDSERAAGYAEDLTTWWARGWPAAVALIAAFIAEIAGGEAGYDDERARQAGWLADRLGLETAP